MNICLESAKVGTICLGDALGSIHGSELGVGHLGLGILALIALAITIFIFRSPA